MAELLDADKLHTGIVYWVEAHNVSQPWPVAFHHIKNAHLFKGMTWECYYGENYPMNDYGKKWRCWSAMPTEEQMRTPWSAQ